MENHKKRKQSQIETPTPFETPDPRSRDSFAPSASKISPIRAGRLEEKAELQELNQRLERYIFRQREKDAHQTTMQKELNILRQSYEGQLKSALDQAAEERRIHHEKRNELSSEKARLEQELERASSLIDQLKRQAEKDQKVHDKQKALYESLSREHQVIKAKLFGAEQEVKQLGNDLDIERDTIERLKTDLDRETRRADEATEVATREKTRAATLQEDYDLETSKYKTLSEQYRKEKEKNARGRQQVEDDLRKEFGNQLQTILEERQEQYEKEKDAVRENLKDYYDLKLKDKTDQLESAQRKADEYASQLREEKKRHSAIEREAAKAIQIRDSLEKTISEFETKLIEERKRYSDEVEEKERIIRNFRERTRQTDEDFNALMDVKIALAMEIKAYRLLIENEEDRLGISLYKSDKKQDATASLVIAAMDLEGSFFKIRNGSTETIELKGWSLRSRETGNELAFPEQLRLHSGDSVTIFTGPDSSQKAKGKNELAWEVEGIWDPNGDSAELVKPGGQVVHDAAVSGPVSAK